jgi:CubicO group peptidase (beta-lactamase class C family)
MNLQIVDAALQDEVDGGRFPGFNYTVIRRGEVVARRCVGFADLERRDPMRLDHLFRLFSCTKLITSIAALQLWEQGRFAFDDPVGDYIPALSDLKVLPTPDAPLGTARAAREPVRIRHLLTHTAGFTYSFMAPQTPIARAYVDAKVSDRSASLAQQMDVLGTLPLLCEPGSGWNYSVSTDVVGRLVEVLRGEPLDACFRRFVFEPLGMRDTGFSVPTNQHARLATHYVGDVNDPDKPSLRNANHLPHEGAFLQPVPRLNPGGGLVGSLDDYTRLVHSLANGGSPLLQPGTMQYVMQDQLPAGMPIGFPGQPLPGRGHSYAASVFRETPAADPAAQAGDVQWSGASATQWMMAPRDRFGLVLMTQRYEGSGLSYWPRFKQAVGKAMER